MKMEAESEEEEILCDIDIEIANMLQGSESKTKGKQSFWESMNKINEYLDILTQGKNGKSDIALLPTETKLYQNYPNPFNPMTTIKFSLKDKSKVSLNVYNYTGQIVKTLVNGQRERGLHKIHFDASQLSSGVYYYTLKTDTKKFTKKMLMIK